MSHNSGTPRKTLEEKTEGMRIALHRKSEADIAVFK